MTVEAEVGNRGNKQLAVIRRVGVVTARTTHSDGGMHGLFRELGPVMAAVAEVGLFRRQALGDRIGLLVGHLVRFGNACMTRRASHLDGGMDDLDPDREAGVAFIAVDLRRLCRRIGSSRRGRRRKGQQRRQGSGYGKGSQYPHTEPPQTLERVDIPAK